MQPIIYLIKEFPQLQYTLLNAFTNYIASIWPQSFVFEFCLLGFYHNFNRHKMHWRWTDHKRVKSQDIDEIEYWEKSRKIMAINYMIMIHTWHLYSYFKLLMLCSRLCAQCMVTCTLETEHWALIDFCFSYFKLFTQKYCFNEWGATLSIIFIHYMHLAWLPGGCGG